MRRYIIAGFIALAAVCALVRAIAAEKADKPELVVRVFDPVFDHYEYSRQIIALLHPEHTSSAFYEQEDDPEETIDNLKEMLMSAVSPGSWDADKGGTIYCRGNQYFIVNTPEVIAEFDRLIAGMRPRKDYYRLRIRLFKRKGYYVDYADGPPIGVTAEMVTQLEEKGFVRALDSEISARAQRITRFENIDERTYIADYNGLISTFSTILDPIVGDLNLGHRFYLYVNEEERGIRLHLALESKILDWMSTVFVNDHPIEKPTLTSSKWQRTFEFTGPSLQVATYFSNGFHQVMLVELLEE